MGNNDFFASRKPQANATKRRGISNTIIPTMSELEELGNERDQLNDKVAKQIATYCVNAMESGEYMRCDTCCGNITKFLNAAHITNSDEKAAVLVRILGYVMANA